MHTKRTLLDYKEELEYLQDIPSFAIIGGMAVEAWATKYMEENELKELGVKPPLTSKDLDGKGTKAHAASLVCNSLAQNGYTASKQAIWSQDPNRERTFPHSASPEESL